MVYINTSHYSNKMNTIENYYLKINRLCLTLKTYIEDTKAGCNYFDTMMTMKISTLKNISVAIHDIIGEDRNIRQKRGWFNVIGRGAKTIFGTLDDTDEERFDNHLKQLESQGIETLELTKSQSNILKIAISEFNETMNNLVDNHNNLVEHLRIMRTNITRNSQDIYKLQLKSKLETHFLIFFIFFEEFEIDTMALTNAILFAQKGILHPSIITLLIQTSQSH